MYTASTSKRVVAYCLDQMLNGIFYLPLIIKAGLHYFKGLSEIEITWMWLFAVLSLQICYQIICLYLLNALPGQLLMGLKVVSTYHPEMGLSLSQCAIHAIAEKLKFFVNRSIYYSAFLNRERRHLVNLLAETRVVQQESAHGLVKPRWLLGSILIVFSLLFAVYESGEFISHSEFSRTGITIKLEP